METSKHPQFAPEATALREVPQPSALNVHHVKDGEAEEVAGLGWLRSFYTEATDAWQRLNQLRTTPRPELTKVAHQQQVNEAFSKATKRVGSARDKAQERIKESAQKYRNDLDLATGLATTGKHDQELRSVLREMPEQKRYQALLDAIEAGDTDVMRSALTAPSLAVGIPADKLKNLRHAWERKTAPEIVQKIERLDKAQQQLVNGFDVWLNDGDKLAFSQEIREAQKAAEQQQAAMQGFESDEVA